MRQHRNAAVALHDVDDVEGYVRGFLGKWQAKNKPLGELYDDAVGELLLVCVDEAGKYDPSIGTFRGYLSNLLPKRLVDFLRRNLGDSRNKTRPEFVPLDDEAAEREIEYDDFVEKIVEAVSLEDDLEALPEWAKRIVDEIVRPIAGGESHDEVAARLGYSRRTVHRLLEDVRNAFLGLTLGLDPDETRRFVEALDRTEDS